MWISLVDWIVLAAGSVRPLSIARELGPITRFALPPEIGQPSPEVLRYLQGIAEGVRQFARERLLQASARGRTGELVEAIAAICEQAAGTQEDYLARQRLADPQFAARERVVECRKGCCFCCHIEVRVSVLEAVHVAAAVQRTSRQAWIGAASAPDRGGVGRDPQGAAVRKAACPLLQHGACSVYEARPLACRALLSTSARACERHFNGAGILEQAPSLVTPRLIAAGILSGHIAAMQDLGLSSHLVELTAALAILLGDRTALRRWVAGEHVFPNP